MLLEDKKAIVTGGTRGIGYAIACRFIEEGAAVTVFGSRQETADAAVAELVERVLLALHGGLSTGGTNSLKSLSDLGGVGGNDRAIGTTRLANHRGSLDVHELVVLLELAVVAALGLGLGQDTRLLKERDSLIGNKGGQGVGRGLVVGKAALLGLNGPLVGVTVAGEQDAASPRLAARRTISLPKSKP